ncbi:MAG: hypothetical protein JSW03_02410, partial [Candidatus Eiseniibacteriota bacterium]
MGSLRRFALSSFLLVCSVFLAGAAADIDVAFARAPIEDPNEGVPAGIYCVRPPDVYTHDVGRVTLQVTNLGLFGNPWIEALSFGYEGGEYLYVAGLWIGALDEDNVPHVSTAAYETELRPSLSVIDKVYTSFEGMSGGLRFGPGGTGDDDGDGLLDEDFHDGYDNDGDTEVDEDFEALGQQMFSCVYYD